MVQSPPPPDYTCHDCGIDTLCSGEYYALTDALWLAIAPVRGHTSGMLCLGCAERRLGRPLTPTDFAAVPLNDPARPDLSFRLRCRLTGADDRQWLPLRGDDAALSAAQQGDFDDPDHASDAD